MKNRKTAFGLFFYLKIYTFYSLSNKEPSWPLPFAFLYKPPMRFMTMRR
ncbi:hypothetical protein [Lacihabitans sp. CS3-21]|nr:hypothetical protein [Lacihabitans sp. CS3-21]